MHYDGDEDDYSLGIEYLKGAYNGICLQGRKGNTRIAVNSNCKIKYVKFNMSENKLSDSVTTYYAGYFHKYEKVNGIYQSDSNRAQSGRLTANGVADYIYIDLDNNFEYYENELNKECSYIDITNNTFLLAYFDSIEVTYEYITDENGWSVNISDDGIISWAPIEGAVIYSISVGPGGGKVNGTSEDLNALCADMGLESGEYTVKLRALDENNSMITGIWTTSFTYSSTLEKLSTPTNVRLEGNILKWNPVEHATRYTVFVYKNGSYIPGMSDVVYDGSMQKSFTFEAGNTYKFAVSASGNGYEDSEKGYSEEYVFETAGNINNVQISEDGILTWDPFEGAAMYSVGIGSGGGFIYGTSQDLKKLCAEFGYSDGTYNVRLMAADEDRNRISENWTGTYEYISTSEKLATPTNVRLEGNILKLDAVEHATRYIIYVYINGTYAEGLSDAIYNGSTQKEIILNAGNTYTFKVQAAALNYEDSEYGISPDYLYKEGKLATLSKLTLEGNTLKWNTVADATSYSVKVYEDETLIDQKTVAETEATFALVSGKTYKFEVVANSDEKEDSETGVVTLTYNNIALENYTVKFHMMGHGTTISNQIVSGGSKAVKPVDPNEEIYVFEGWCTDAGCTTLFDFDTAIVADITIYAKWRCPHVYSELWSFDKTGHWHECNVCGAKKDNVENHDFSKYVSNGGGTHKVECVDCGASEEGHDKDACSGGTATCTAKVKCSKCKAEYGSLKAHTNTTTTTKATTSKDGSKVSKCLVCGKVASTTTIAMPKTFTLSKTSVEYTGSQIKPTITVKDKNGTTIAAANYTVTYGTNKAVGKGTVKVTFKSTSNYSGNKELSFNIIPKKTTIGTPAIASDGITVKWIKNTSCAGYYIYRSVNGASYTKVKTITSNATVSWKDTGAKTNGNKYQYKIVAYKTVSGTTYTSGESSDLKGYQDAAKHFLNNCYKVGIVYENR